MTYHGLGEFEQVVLLAIAHLRGEAYGVPIVEEIERRTGRAVARAAVYVTLRRLEEKGFVSSWIGDPTPERGGEGAAEEGAGEARGGGDGAHRAFSPAGSSPCHMRSAACRASPSARAPSASSRTQRRPLPPRSGVGSLIHDETNPFSSSRRRVT